MNWPNDIVKGFWTPAWVIQLDLKLNHIHATQEKIMAEIEDLRAAQEKLKTEVGEAIAKQSETMAKLAEALANAGDLEALKGSVREAITEVEGQAKALDDAFGTGTFTPSGN